MAPLPVTNTARFVVDYLWRGIPYTTVFRFPAEASQATAAGYLDTFHTALKAAMSTNWSCPGTGVWYPYGSNISNPATCTPVAAGTGGADIANNPDALQHQIVGRSNDGRRVSWYFSGVGCAIVAKQRVATGVVAQVTALISAFSTQVVAGHFVSISGQPVYIKNYANQVINDYLTQQARRG